MIDVLAMEIGDLMLWEYLMVVSVVALFMWWKGYY
jgi:hypothetical protein